MAKKIDTQTAALAAAQGSAAVFQAEEEIVATASPQPQTEAAPEVVAQTVAAAPTQIEDVLKMNAMNPMDYQAATAKAADTVKAMFEPRDVVARTTKLTEDAAEIARGNMEAVVASTRIVAQQAGTITQDVAEIGRKNFEGVSEAMKSLAGAKTPAEFVKVQGEFAKTSIEAMVANGTRMTETMVKMVGQAMEPVQARYAANAEKMKIAK